MAGDDRLSPLARWMFLPLVPLTAVFGPLLVFAPGHTAQFWAWSIRPSMSAVWVGAGYTFGACAISTMLVLNRWRTSILATVATIPFAYAMIIATLLHLDRFPTGSVRFWVWLVIYAALPLGLPVILVRNRGADPGIEPDDRLLPRWLGRGAGVVGGLIDAFGVALFTAPAAVGKVWPWLLTPLMAQVVAGWLMFFGTGTAMLAFERRYRAVRAFLPSVAVWFGVLDVAALFHLDDFTNGPFATAVYFTGATLVVLVSLAILGWGRRAAGYSGA
ncbi:MAG TPA: hypothetical protein VJT31_36175 [Rugosimonospora sp.]|nr:hypothetical protein [Rugosimonospora sp.]